MIRLCFGTFAQILRLCKLENVTDPLLVGTMTRTVDPDCQYINGDNATAVSRLISCNGNLSNGRANTLGRGVVKKPGESISNVINAALKVNKMDVVQKFRKDVLCLLDEDKKERAVLALLDIIQRDTVLDDEKKLSFEKYVGKTKNALLSQDEFVLDELFAGIFLYTVAAGVVNTVGKPTVKGITVDYLNKLTNSRGIKIIDHASREIKGPHSISEAVHSSALSDIFDQHSVIAKPNFKAYLTSAKNKYSTIKTLLYNDQPKPFYDFYVCNNIERRIPIPGKHRSSYKLITIADVTVKTLSECSRFVILAGTGGLGKSMMMRHLLLNSVDNYEDEFILPVFIALKDFDETVDSVFEYAYSKVTSLCDEITKDQFEVLLHKGKCLLLFDGLDEIGSSNAKRFERDLEVFTDKYPENHFVISSRPYQSFISYSRFTVLQLKPFSKVQALKLIDNLEFRPDEPIIKEKFRTEINDNLYRTHSTFIENPLLLTIMLLTFEHYAEVPSKMHVFYREAFSALSIKHDASKGAFRRPLKTGLTADKFADYFAEICSRSYHDEKFELTEDEFAKYYDVLKEREKVEDTTTTASDFLFDLCSNMCLMYFESGKFHFTHRSFQEYFCALYFSKQKDKTLKNIGDFFEKRRNRMYGDKTFNMMYDMIPDKVEEYIFLPFLTKLYYECDSEDGYWTFLERIYPTLNYEKGKTDDYISNEPESYLFAFVMRLNNLRAFDCNHFPHYDSLVTSTYAYIINEDEDEELVNADDVELDYIDEHGTPDEVGWVYALDVEDVRMQPIKYKELLECLDDDDFSLKEIYVEIREYLKKLQAKQKRTGDSLFDLF